MFDVPNLDGLTDDPAELLELSSVLGILACYADYKARAIRHRKGGDVEAALSFERAADFQYKRLPEWARW